MNSLRERIRVVKLSLLSVVLLTLGVTLLFIGRHATGSLALLPMSDIGGSLFTTGLLGITLYYLDARDGEERDIERLRRVLRESAPEIRDAVVRGFAVEPNDLKRVATPAMLDQLATNALALRLDDEQFAAELYADVRDLAIRTPERWYDVDVSIRLSAVAETSASGAGLLAAIITWEYTVAPQEDVRRFACTSDLDEFHELIRDIPTTSTWFMSPRPGIDPAQRDSFEVLSLSVDGVEQRIHRSQRKSGQVYTVDMSAADSAHPGLPVRIRHTYRAVTDRTNHRLFVAIAQPARNVHVDVDYSDAEISRMSVTDVVPTSRRPYVSQLPAQATGKELTIEVPGWLQAGTGFTFVWTSASEEPSAAQRHRPTPPAAAA